LFRFVRESVKRKLIVDTEESRQATNWARNLKNLHCLEAFTRERLVKTEQTEKS
jgi:hypothetical protein